MLAALPAAALVRSRAPAASAADAAPFAEPQIDRYATRAPMLRAVRPPVDALSAVAPPPAPARRAPAQAGAPSGARMADLTRAPASGGAPSSREPANDRQLNRLLAQARHHLRKGNWLHYRDLRLSMADLQRRRGHLLDALTLYLDVWYIDLNGPRDSLGPEQGAMLGTEDPEFDPRRAAPRSPARRAVRKLMHALDLQPRHVHTLFLDAAGPTYHTLNLPLTPSEAWARIGPELLF